MGEKGNYTMTFSEKAAFVKSCGELLRIAKPNLVSCELLKGADIQSVTKTHIPTNDYVKVLCENGYFYTINVTANSLCSIASEIFNKMTSK